MSQAGVLTIASGNLPPSVATSYVTNAGTAVPVAHVLNILGSIQAAGSIPLQTTASGNTVNVIAQYGQAAAASNPLFAGMVSLNAAQFIVDAFGFVSLLGSGAMETLTPNSGGAVAPVGGTINVLGLAANAGANAFPIFSYNGGAGVFNLENRAFLSAYVVDTSVTNGSRGTFATLGAAITQAIADGATGVGKTIYVRNVTIAETITVATNSVNISIIGTGGKNNTETSGGNPLFTGSFTNSGSANILFSDIDFSGAASLTNSGTGTISLDQSLCLAALTQSNAASQIILGNTQLNSSTVTISGGIISAYQTGISGGTITFSNAAAFLHFNGTNSATLTGNTSGLIQFYNCYMPIANSLSSGTMSINNCSFGTASIYSNTNVNYQTNGSAGNVYSAIRVAASYGANNGDFYIGVTSTAAPRTITIPTTNVIKNQSFIVKDESGGAAANNITVVIAGGVKTIDGQTSYIISNNYGSVQIIYDGTNFFVL